MATADSRNAGSRIRIFVGALLLVVGSGCVAVSARVLSTFLLDVVVRAIKPDKGPALEPYDFSWGTMHWGRSSADFTTLCTGLLLIAVGQALVLPALIHRIKAAPADTRRTFPKLWVAGASVLTLFSAVSFLLIPSITRSAFGTIAVVGAVDPVSLAEDLPVRSSQVFMVCLLAAQLLLVMAVFTMPKSGPIGSAPGGKGLSFAACSCLLLFALALAAIRLGPVLAFADVGVAGGSSDPGEIAGQIALVIHLMMAAGVLLAAAAVLTGVALLSPVKHVG
jgi:hypothetical protein